MNRIIGFTYDLKDEYIQMGYSNEEAAECDRIETIDAICAAIEKLGFIVDKIGNIYNLTKRLALGDRWDLVFNICEGITGAARESQVPALLDSYSIPYTFSDAGVLAITLYKNVTKHLISARGINTPAFIIVNNLLELEKIDLNYPLFVKPDSEGTSKGIDANSKVHNKFELKNKVKLLLDSSTNSVLIEEYLPGREFTVGILGSNNSSKIYEIMEITVNNPDGHSIYSYDVKEDYEKFVKYSILEDSNLRDAISSLCLKAWNTLGCRDGGRIDVKLDITGNPSFIEVNPLAGLNPLRSDLPIMGGLAGLEYDNLIKEILDSALARTKICC